ncbi:DnaB-like helicase N-terminal domain-containing protein [Lichenihabitans sp. Uapishka_5]|uniref:DnaB-like helicase N-terminal domain-containing protein n=1 Tax=Lichenihabitans sp. Uapishka_5 TaxID=3037302 RepID=UPI0029E7F5A5|nr:DnaB-like helicase N-terminal domain-containing protein [Lichenihabitans sp. Uapishka_5]MDX7953746.1 DnaB-like helicase N-terminal domain-containing protein [Lichenihabitans sp. Uapishka_5]
MARDTYAMAPDASRPPPSNVELEQSLLGSLLIRNDVLDVVAPILDTTDFSEEIHRRIFDVAKTLIGAGQAATSHTLQTYLGNPEIAQGVSLSQYIARICTESALPIMAKDYARGVRELAE